MKKKTNEYYLEHWARIAAGPAQPEVEKEKAAPAESSKPQASSLKLQAPSSKQERA